MTVLSDRLFQETEARLAVASYGAETQAIGLDHMAATGRHLAEVLFTRVSAEPFTNAEINTAIFNALEGLQESIVASFEAFGISGHPFVDQCLEAASSGFLDRGEALFSAPKTGGRA